MNHIVVVEKNKDGKIELTKEELQRMLDDAYNKGYVDGGSKYDTITYPSYKKYNPEWYTVTCANTAASTSVSTSANTD